MRKYCLALDLVDNEKLIAEYEEYHRSIWPDILESIHESGIEKMEIYRISNRLFMIMEVSDDFSFERKRLMDEANPKVQEWETLMWKYQSQIPGSKINEKWVLMDLIFESTKS